MDYFFTDGEFNQALEEKILPWARENLKEGYVDCFDDSSKRIHYAYALNPNARGVVVVSHGFCEFITKFHEMLYFFYQAGYSVFMPEHRGHGFSHREVANPDIVHIDDFHTYVSDFENFFEKVVKEKAPEGPYILYAHSMGGAVGALFLERNPDLISKAILTSPMIEMTKGGQPKILQDLIKSISYAPFLSKKFCIGQHGYDGVCKFEASSARSEARYAYTMRERAREVNYHTYGASFAWIRESLNISKEILKNAQKVKASVILFQAGEDNLVVPEAQEAFAKDATDCKIIKMPGCKHELYSETDEMREIYLLKILEFLEE